MDTKWIAIMMVGIIGFGMLAESVSTYTKGQCKLAYAQSEKTADEINKICK